MSIGKVNFRGRNGDIYIEVVGDDLDLIMEDLDLKCQNNSSFYSGAEIVGISSDALSIREKLELAFLLKYKYGFKISDKSLDEISEGRSPLDEKEEELKDGVLTKFVNKTIRSGQSIDYDGNIVIIGDVNSGAIVKATGSIIVLGSFRGVGHAGYLGDEDSIVASYNLIPTQLRIGDKIARSPDRGSRSNRLPEMAKIVNDSLVIEPYLPNK